MQTTSYYPVIMTRDVHATTDFYARHFDLQPLFTADWYVHLQSKTDQRVELAVLDGTHDTIPPASRGQVAAGLLLNFEVTDVDAVHDRLQAAGVPIALTLRNEAFGQRHFIVQAPDGVLVDVIQPIPPSAEYAAQYAQEALPG